MCNVQVVIGSDKLAWPAENFQPTLRLAYAL